MRDKEDEEMTGIELIADRIMTTGVVGILLGLVLIFFSGLILLFGNTLLWFSVR